jgi:tetratricopeptide (TPR) repeat protein
MRTQFGNSCTAGILGLGLLIGGSLAAAENEGSADLEQAIEMHLSALSAADRGKVINLCQSTLDKGLSQKQEQACKRLLFSSLLRRARPVAYPLAVINIETEYVSPRFSEPGTKSWRAAVKDVERAVAIDPKHPEAQLLMGRLQWCFRGGDREKARQAIDEAIHLAGDDVEIKAKALGLRADMRNNPEDRLADLSEAITLAPKNKQLLHLRGMLYLRLHKPDKALADFDGATKPGDDSVLVGRAQALEAMKRYREARDCYSRLVGLMPDSFIPLLFRGRMSGLAGEYQQGLDDANRALAMKPDEPYGLVLRASALTQLGRAQDALPDINRALALQPHSTDVIGLWAAITEKAGKSTSTIRELRQKVEVNPNDAATWLQLGLLYAGQRQMGKAIDALTAVLDLGRHPGFALQQRGHIYSELRMRKEALADFQRALTFDPDNSYLLSSLAWFMATSPEPELRDGKKAIELASRACELTNCQDACVLSTLAAAFAENGDFQTARTWSEKSLEIADEALELDGKPVKELLRKELACYEKGEPYREALSPPEGK